MILGILHHEAGLCYGFVRRDLGTGLLPVPGFTLASLLYRGASYEEMVPVIGRKFSPSFQSATCSNQLSRRIPLRFSVPLHFRSSQPNRWRKGRQNQQA